jgi:hypothetical protein
MTYPLFAVFSPILAGGAALAAVGVPLAIHLLFRKRHQIVQWAAMRFLLASERKRKRRIDQWLLLALRVGALALILFAMIAATPWAEGLWQAIKPGAAEVQANLPRTHHTLVIDGSLSMTAKGDDARPRFARAIDQAEALVRSAGPGSGFTVVFMANAAQTVVAGPSNDIEKVVAELRKLKPTHGPTDHTAALAMLADVVTRSPKVYPRRQLTFFTDVQRASWANAIPRPENTTGEHWKRITARADVAVVDLARIDADNLAVAGIELGEPMPLVDQPAEVVVTVANLGRAEKKGARVELAVGKPIGGEALVPLATKTLEPIPAGTRGNVKFDLVGNTAFRERGVHVVQARLVEGDDLPADDVRALAVEVRDGLHALLIDGKADPDPKRRAATHLHRALFPPGAKPSDTPARPRTVTPAEFLDPAVGDISNVDCVFVCDVANPTAEFASKLEAVLRRGGTVVFGMGTNAASSKTAYNEVLYRDGTGLLPGPLGDLVTVAGPDDLGFRLFAEEEEFRKMPLLPFGGDKPRAGLVSVPFRSYVKVELPTEGRGRRVASFARATIAKDEKKDDKKDTEPKKDDEPKKVDAKKDGDAKKPDPALVEWHRHRGRVYVYTSTFNEDWNDWPALFSYLPFWNEFLRYSVANPDRHTLTVGEVVEEFFPASASGLSASLVGPEGLSATVPVVLQEEAGVARFPGTLTSGIYRIGVNGPRDRAFAVNVPEVVAGAPTESDLRRLDANEFKPVGPVQIVGDQSEVKASDENGTALPTTPKPHGPMLARTATCVAVAVMLLEVLIAWQFGRSRSSGPPSAGRGAGRFVGTAAALVPLALAGLVLFTVFHAESTQTPLGFLPPDTRAAIERAAGVPTAAPGEGTKWRLDGFNAFFRNAVTDRRFVGGLALLCVAFTCAAYLRERAAAAGRPRVLVPALLRCSAFLLALFVLLSQLRLSFDREGWPEVAIVLDVSASMAKADEYKDPTVRAKAEELAGGASNLSQTSRLKLAQLLLARKDFDWLEKLLHEKQVKVRVYSVAEEATALAGIEEDDQLAAAREAIEKLKPEGDASHLGDGVEAVLKAYRGSSLAALIMFTDGVNTAGDDLPKAARAAAIDGVPLYLIGVGDTWETPDLSLADLQAEDVVGRGDRIAFEARLTARGKVPPGPVVVSLKEKLSNGRVEERSKVSVTPDPNGNPVTVQVGHTPDEVGEKTYILSVPPVPGETNTRNNQIERTVLVTDSRKIRALLVEGYPRYDFRFIKTMLERESDKSVGGKSVELQVVLLDSSKGWADTDRSAFRGEFPTRTELFGYDVVILGDVDPKALGGARAAAVQRDLADFVREKGGGLLFLSGEHGTPAAYADTPLADVLPVAPGDAPPARNSEEQPLTEEFQPKLTPAGRLHPLFRFSGDEAESLRVWNRLRPLMWYAKGYKRKPLTSVLAVHPTKPAEGGAPGENHPLVIQQYAGAGPVLFVGFDDTWRWRFRNDEEHFDRFWMQALRVLSRSRVRRPEVRVAPKTEFRRDERVLVQVRFPIEAPTPPGDTPVRVQVTRSPLPKPDGTPGAGPTDANVLALQRVPGPTILYEAALPRAPDGEYRFELTDPEVPGSRPWATARVLPPMNERERVELNRADLAAAATVSGGGSYTLANATDVFGELKNLTRVPLNQPCPPVPVWNQPLVYLLVLLLLTAEWLLRKRERLL